jgi:hypothetical protein
MLPRSGHCDRPVWVTRRFLFIHDEEVDLMMTLKKFAIGAAFAASITAGSLGMGSSAQAADIAGKTLSFNGSAKLLNPDVAIGGTSTLDFVDAEVGAFSEIGTPAGSFSILDLVLEKTSATTWKLAPTPVVGWLSGGALGSVIYDLTKFDLVKSNGTFAAAIDGIFKPQMIGTEMGEFSSQARLALNGTTYSADITAVPVPALLPGAIGLGVAALRKRKQLATAQA